MDIRKRSAIEDRRKYKQIKDIGVFYRQMAIQLSDIAFSELPIKFSPDMNLEQREKSLKRIKSTLPGANVYEI